MNNETLQRSGVNYCEVRPNSAGQRLDNFLFRELKNVPTTHVYRLIRTGQVRVNSKRSQVSYRLQLGDSIRIPPVMIALKAQMPYVGQALQTSLLDAMLYEDDDLLVINKPSGVAVHGSSSHSVGLIEALRTARPDLDFIELVHRLDQATSGVLLLAKNRATLVFIQDQWRAQLVNKKYLALVQGIWPSTQRRIECALERRLSSDGERYVKVSVEGKVAITEVSILHCFTHATLLALYPLTGRTHQLRVHTAKVGYPILGDEKYGEKKINRAMRKLGLSRLFLHAEQLCVMDRKGQSHQFTAPLPQELNQVLKNFSAYHKKQV